MFSGRTAATILVTPQDEYRDPGLIERTLRSCWQHTRGPVALSEFGAQWTVLWEEMARYLDRGGYLWGVFDERQWALPATQKSAKPFIQKYPKPFTDQCLVCGNSQYGSQILHDKKIVFNAPINGFQPTVGDYETVDDALAAGACVSWFGSLNLSVDASKQANTVCIMPGIVVGTMFVDCIRQNHDYIRLHQQKYQPFPVEVS